MLESIYYLQATAAKRRSFFVLLATTNGQPIAVMPSLTGVKAYLSKAGAAAVATTNDVAAVGTTTPGLCYLELTLAEATAFASGTIVGSVKDAAGCQPEAVQFFITPYDPESTAAPDVNLLTVKGGALIGDGVTTPYHI